METLFFFGIILLLASRGTKMKLYRSFKFLLCIAFASYIAIWSLPTAAAYLTVIPDTMGSFRLMAGLISVFFVCLLCLCKVNVMVSPILPDDDDDTSEFVFPREFDKLGGVLCNAMSGMILASLLLLVFCISPYHQKVKFINAKQSAKILEVSIPAFSSAVDILSFQSENIGRQKAYLAKILEPAKGISPQPPLLKEKVASAKESL